MSLTGHNAMHRGVRVALLLALVWLAGCASVPQRIEISAAQLQQRIAERFPVDSRVLQLFDVRVGVPHLTLLPDSNRIATRLELTVSDRWLQSPYRGVLSLSYALRFEPADQTIRLAAVRVERLQIDAVPAALQRQLDHIGIVLAEQLLDGRVLHTLRAADVAAMRARGVAPGEITVERRGISIALVPVQPR